MDKEKVIHKQDCPHIGELKITSSEKTQCEVCDIKEDLRLCTSCGAVHCCEDGNSHDTDHFKSTDHPIIIPVHTKYHFTWCYKCEAYLK